MLEFSVRFMTSLFPLRIFSNCSQNIWSLTCFGSHLFEKGHQLKGWLSSLAKNMLGMLCLNTFEGSKATTAKLLSEFKIN